MTTGELASHQPLAVIGVHLQHQLPPGTVGAAAGTVNASSDEFEITVTGRGGHAGYPHLAVNPVPALCAAVVALQQVDQPVRRPDPRRRGLGRRDRGRPARHNVIPETATGPRLAARPRPGRPAPAARGRARDRDAHLPRLRLRRPGRPSPRASPRWSTTRRWPPRAGRGLAGRASPSTTPSARAAPTTSPTTSQRRPTLMLFVGTPRRHHPAPPAFPAAGRGGRRGRRRDAGRLPGRPNPLTHPGPGRGPSPRRRPGPSLAPPARPFARAAGPAPRSRRRPQPLVGLITARSRPAHRHPLITARSGPRADDQGYGCPVGNTPATVSMCAGASSLPLGGRAGRRPGS